MITSRHDLFVDIACSQILVLYIEVKHDHGGGRARGDRKMRDRVMDVEGGQPTLVMDKRSALACLFGKRQGSMPVLSTEREIWGTRG